MKVWLMNPKDPEAGWYAETVAIFAARRCRSVKTHDELFAEVIGYDYNKRRAFVEQVVNQDWAADVLEMIHLTYDIEGVPVWLVIELLRHRLIAREFSLEQLSQRAIASFKLQVEAPAELQALVDEYVDKITRVIQDGRIPPEQAREAFPQGVLVNFCIAGNMRAFHHFFWMRSSQLYGGKGGAHPKFMAMADEMQKRAADVLPLTMGSILKA